MSIRRFEVRLVLAAVMAAFVALSACGAHAATIKVGGDAACDTHDFDYAVQTAAQMGGANTIKLAYNQTYNAVAETLTGALEIDGGFADCAATTATSTTTLSGTGASGPVLAIGTGSQIVLDKLIVTGGTGGGIHAIGASTVLVLTDVEVTQNHSANDGGGIYLDGAALYAYGRMFISSNTSDHRGGGLYAHNVTTLHFNVEGSAPAISSVTGNSSQGIGGGFCLDGSQADIRDVAFVSNQAAQNGGAIAMLNNSVLYYAVGSNCPAGVICTTMSQNKALGNAYAGAILAVDSNVTIYSAQLANNSGYYAGAIYSSGSGKLLTLQNVLMTGTSAVEFPGLGSAAVVVGGGVNASVYGSTFAANTGVDATFRDEAGLGIYDSLIADVQPFALGTSYSTFYFDCVLLKPQPAGQSWLSHGTRSMEVSDFGFLNEATANYRLRATGLATDYCDTSKVSLDSDLDGYPRNVDALDQPNTYGTTDLGAYESTDSIFYDGFE